LILYFEINYFGFDIMRKILVTGSNRGIGLEFVKQFLEKGDEVIATCRDPKSAKALNELKTLHSNSLTIIPLDVTNYDQICQAFDRIQRDFNSIDILINNAGVKSGDGKNLYNFGEVHKEDFMKVLQINTLAPLLISEKFTPLLQNVSNSKIINITSTNGSISKRKQKGKYSYCVSKAGLNMVSKILSNDLHDMKITVIALQPGWIKTDMGGPEAPLEIDETISKIIDLIDKIDHSDTGKFLKWDGTEIPW
jgi:NAD(P)-dependent dehydrogenase (short-subunit alcohol dehydrogenase family)